MSKPDFFCVDGRRHADVPYHYRECGLDNIFLLNGFDFEYHDGDRYISVHNADELWKAIGLHLVEKQKTLSPKEVRFLRNHMRLTQAELAQMLRVDDQTVARWEKGKSKLPGPADLALRAAFLGSNVAQPEGSAILNRWLDLVANLIGRDQVNDLRLTFQRDEAAWTEGERPRLAANMR